MPFYYSIATSGAVSASANTDTDMIRYATGSTRMMALSRLILANTGAAAQDSQIYCRLSRFGTASTTGTAATPRPHDVNAQAAVTTAFTLPTIGTTETQVLNLGFNSRAMVQWVALNPDEAIVLVAGAGANGNLDLIAQEAAGTAFTLRYNITHYE